MASTPHLFVLVEAAAGYSLFEVVAFEEISASLTTSPSQQSTVTSLPLFSRCVKLKAFQPFSSAEDALANINAISEHAMTDSLRSFLEMNLPAVSSKKKKKEGSVPPFSLGIIDPGLATAIAEGIPGMSCRSDDTVREIVRGARTHLSSMVKGLAGGGAEQAQLGLGHSYSRGKVKFNPARSDNMIIQAIALLDQMDGDLNTFAMRVKEWYSYHFPELRIIVKDNYMFARCAAFIQDKRTLFPPTVSHDDDQEMEMEHAQEDRTDKLPGLIEIVGDDEMANTICAAAKTSMGMECSPVDMINIINFTQRMVRLAEFKKQLTLYLTEKMSIVAPNLSALIGDTVGARLISKAGSLTNLAKAPASTVQILGAEKALFRALKTKGNTPKYGLIYHSTFIGRAAAKNKGRISRYLANKCSIATRIDSFSDEPTRVYGEKLRDQVEERLKFYETGAAPRKNLDVMVEIRKGLEAGKAKAGGEDVDMEDGEEVVVGLETPKEKKKRKKEKKSSSKKRARGDDEDEDDENTKEAPESEKKSAKKSAKKSKKEPTTPVKEPVAKDEDADDDDDDDVMVETPKAEKKSAKKSAKKSKKEATTPAKEDVAKDEGVDDAEETKSAKKSAKKAKKEVATPKKEESDDADDDGAEKKSAKKRKTPKSDKKSAKKEKKRKSKD